MGGRVFSLDWGFGVAAAGAFASWRFCNSEGGSLGIFGSAGVGVPRFLSQSGGSELAAAAVEVLAFLRSGEPRLDAEERLSFGEGDFGFSFLEDFSIAESFDRDLFGFFFSEECFFFSEVCFFWASFREESCRSGDESRELREEDRFLEAAGFSLFLEDLRSCFAFWRILVKSVSPVASIEAIRRSSMVMMRSLTTSVFVMMFPWRDLQAARLTGSPE